MIKELSDADKQILLEQYKLYVGTAEAVSQRRQNCNSFFITANAAILTLVSFIHKQTEMGIYSLLALSVAGSIISLLWYHLLSSYKDLNSAKFKVVHEMEKSLPAALFDEEWALLKQSKSITGYIPFTLVERLIPLVFLLMHIVFCIFIALKP